MGPLSLARDLFLLPIPVRVTGQAHGGSGLNLLAQLIPSLSMILKKKSPSWSVITLRDTFQGEGEEFRQATQRMWCRMGAEIDGALDQLGPEEKIRALRFRWEPSEDFPDQIHCWMGATEIEPEPRRPLRLVQRTTLRIYSREPHAQNPV